MTTRQQFLTQCARLGLNPTTGLNLLQEHGRISDLCVNLDDVPESDLRTAVGWMALL